jgi:hypothetical protein
VGLLVRSEVSSVLRVKQAAVDRQRAPVRVVPDLVRVGVLNAILKRLCC